ncbi:hypothetical protein B0H14DRAFT_3860319 [Mycena olivaceomarginata]|nr:hypothetical protein B0H14DRAFT_3860319 [Mycena olivaceomarginata]
MDTLGSTLGALFIGLIISSVLHGVTLAQAGYYFGGQKRFRDPVPLRILVSLIVTLDLVHQVCTSNWIYIFCVTKFGDTAGLAILPPSYLGMAYPTGFVTFIVQGHVFNRARAVHREEMDSTLLAALPSFASIPGTTSKTTTS